MVSLQVVLARSHAGTAAQGGPRSAPGSLPQTQPPWHPTDRQQTFALTRALQCIRCCIMWRTQASKTLRSTDSIAVAGTDGSKKCTVGPACKETK
jgi:hypothetical protein